MLRTPQARRGTAFSFECPAERFLGVISDASRDADDAEIRGGEQVLRDVHPPLGEVADRGAAEHLPKARIEQGPRHRSFLSKLSNRPLVLRHPMQQSHRWSQHRVTQRSYPAMLGGRGSRQM